MSSPRKERNRFNKILIAATLLLSATTAWSQEEDKLARQLANPIASLISVPLQSNWEFGAGPEEDTRYVLNFQPVVPSSLNQDWNLITRVVAPVVSGGSSSGLSDITASFFISPAQPRGVIWGAGPVFLLPMTSDPFLGREKWGVGPTFVVLKQSGHWMYGALANHIWSFAGDEERSNVSATFAQPFVSLLLGKGRTLNLNTEATRDWKAGEWTVPVNLQFSKVTKIGMLPASLAIGGGYFVEKPTNGPSWKMRVNVTFLFPRKG